MGANTIQDQLIAELLGDVGVLHDDVKALKAALPGAAADIEKAGINAAESLKIAVGDAVSELSKASHDLQVEKFHAEFIRVANTVLNDIGKTATTAAPSAWKVKVAVSMTFVIALSGIAGGIIGATYYHQGHSQEETREIAAGKDFLKVLPQLDEATKNKIANLLEKNRSN